VAEDFVVSVIWLENYRFEARARDNVVYIDQRKEEGGEGRGFKPTELLLSALASCLMTNIVKILNFRKAKILEFSGTAKVEKRKFTLSIFIRAVRNGVEIDRSELEEILNAAMETCKISSMLREECEVLVELLSSEEVKKS